MKNQQLISFLYLKKAILNKMKKGLLLFLGILGILLFFLQIFVFEKPNGFIGYLICNFSILLTIVSFIKLFQISKTFRHVLTEILDLLWFWG